MSTASLAGLRLSTHMCAFLDTDVTITLLRATLSAMPTVRQRRLGAELKNARRAAGLTLEQAAATLGIAHTTMGRWESAENRPPLARVTEMLGLYGGDEAMQLAIMELARKVRERGWWAPYGGVLDPSFAEAEADASRIRTWNVQVVHGLLQTPDYARAVLWADATDEDEVNRRIQAREHRKAVLARDDAPTLEVLLDEAVLRRSIGDCGVMRGQLRALLEAGARATVSVRVVPTSLGAYPYIGNGSVTIFGFRRPIDPDVAYIESFAGGIFVEDVGEVRRCNLVVDRISEMALSEEESAALIGAIIKE